MAAGIIAAIVIAFQLFSAAEPLLSLLIQYLIKYYAQHAKALWGDQADANMKTACEAANRIVSQVTIDPITALNQVSTMWPTPAALEQQFPGICQSIMARHILMEDVPGTSHGMAAKLVEGAHAQMTIAASEG
jgi:hypothetical protein